MPWNGIATLLIKGSKTDTITLRRDSGLSQNLRESTKRTRRGDELPG
jgi:hypothetical protein